MKPYQMSSWAATIVSTPPDPMMLLFCYLVSAAVACLGFAWFQKTRKGFADVL